MSLRERISLTIAQKLYLTSIMVSKFAGKAHLHKLMIDLGLCLHFGAGDLTNKLQHK